MLELSKNNFTNFIHTYNRCGFLIYIALVHLKRLLLLTLIAPFGSCTPLDHDAKSGVDHGLRDSILFHYQRSLDTALSTADKKRAINRSLSFYATIGKDSLFGRLLYKKELLSLNLGEYDSISTYHGTLIEHALQSKDMPILARQHYFMGYYYDRFTVLSDSAFSKYNHAKNYFSELKDSLWVGITLLNMGTIQKDQNDFFGSKETVTEAMQYLSVSRNTKEMVQCYNLLATNHRKLFNYDDAVTYYKKAIANSVSRNNRTAFENNLGTTLIDDGKYEEAISIFEKIMEDASLDRTSSQYARVLDNLSYAKWLLGNSGNVDPFREALAIRIKKGDMRGQLASYTHLGEFYMEKNPQMATAYFDTVIQVSGRIKNPRAETDALKFLMQLEPQNVQHHERYIFLNDSLYREQLNVKTQFAKYKYDDKLRQGSILRLEREKAEQALLTAKERNKKTMSYLGSLMLLLGLSFAFYFFGQRTKRLKARNKLAKLEATLATEAEMSRRLHDDFGAGLNQAMLMLQGGMDKVRVLDRLDELYNQSRNFSREVNEVDTGHRFKDQLLEMLRFRTPTESNMFLTGGRDIAWADMTALSQKVLFKALQELMINMGRHSHATMVTIGFKHSGKNLEVKYSDNGVGASQGELNTKNGLRNTEKRIQAIGGSITFATVKDEGFKVHLTIPF